MDETPGSLTPNARTMSVTIRIYLLVLSGRKIIKRRKTINEWINVLTREI